MGFLGDAVDGILHFAVLNVEAFLMGNGDKKHSGLHLLADRRLERLLKLVKLGVIKALAHVLGILAALGNSLVHINVDHALGEREVDLLEELLKKFGAGVAAIKIVILGLNEAGKTGTEFGLVLAAHFLEELLIKISRLTQLNGMNRNLDGTLLAGKGLVEEVSGESDFGLPGLVNLEGLDERVDFRKNGVLSDKIVVPVVLHFINGLAVNENSHVNVGVLAVHSGSVAINGHKFSPLLTHTGEKSFDLVVRGLLLFLLDLESFIVGKSDLGEMFNHYELAKSCGSSAAKIYMPETVKKIAAARWNDLLRTDAETMLTVNPESYECLEDAVPEGRKLEDLYQVLDQAT